MTPHKWFDALAPSEELRNSLLCSKTRRRGAGLWARDDAFRRHQPGGSPACLRCAPLQLQRFQVFAERAAQVRAAQSELHGGFEEAEFVAGVVALAFEAERVDGADVEQVFQ